MLPKKPSVGSSRRHLSEFLLPPFYTLRVDPLFSLLPAINIIINFLGAGSVFSGIFGLVDG